MSITIGLLLIKLTFEGSLHFIEVLLFYQGANMNGVSITILGFLFFAVVQLDSISSMSSKRPSFNSTNNVIDSSRESLVNVVTPSFRVFRILQETQSRKSTSVGLKSAQHCTTTMTPEEKKSAVNILSGNVGKDKISLTLSASLEDKQSIKSSTLQKESVLLETKDKSSPGKNKRSRKRRPKDDINCPRSCTCESCSVHVKGITMKCKTDNVKKFLGKLKISKSKVCSL